MDRSTTPHHGDHDLLLTTSQVARRLEVSVDRVRQLTRGGRLPFRQTPLGRLYETTAVEAFAAQRGADATAADDSETGHA